jgi:ATP-dependent DNA helicase RecG
MSKWQESEVLEFKENLNELSSEHGRSTDGIASLAGFANKKGGKVYFGVKNDGTVIGLNVSEKTLRDVANQITATTDPPIIAEVRAEDTEGKTVLLVSVAQSDERPHKYKGIPYVRSGSATKQMPDGMYQRMLDARPAAVDFTARVIAGSSVEDLSQEALKKLQELLSLRDSIWKTRSSQQSLADLLLTEGEALTFAGLLMVGKPEAIQRHLPQAEIRYLWYSSPEATQFSYHNRDTSACQPLLLQLDMLLAEIKIPITNIQMGLFRAEVKDFEREVLQEAILNAVMHRDYRIPSHIFVKHFPTHIEVTSPGAFFGGITADNILFHPPRYRNLRLARALARVFAVQQAGQGVDIMVEELARRGQRLRYQVLDNNVALTLPAGVIDKNLFAFISKVQESGVNLSLVHILILEALKQEKGSTKSSVYDALQLISVSREQADSAIEYLIKHNVVEGFGERRGRRYFLDKTFYRELGEKGDLTKVIGPSAKAIEVTIIDHLQRFEKGRVGDFLEALSISPNDKTLRRRVSRVLDSLVNADVLDYDKKRRWTSYWLKKKS